MAILDVFKKEKGKGEGAEKSASKKRAPAKTVPHDAALIPSSAHLLIKPYVTEKATVLADGRNIFTFKVAPHANKTEVKKAVKALYGVTPVKVAMINLPAKVVSSRGRFGMQSGKRKALVYLKKGDTIEFA